MKPAPMPENSIRFFVLFSVFTDVVPGDGQTVRQAAEVAGLSSGDDSSLDVFDDLGNVVNDLPAADMIGESLFIGPREIIGCGTECTCFTNHQSEHKEAVE